MFTSYVLLLCTSTQLLGPPGDPKSKKTWEIRCFSAQPTARLAASQYLGHLRIQRL